MKIFKKIIIPSIIFILVSLTLILWFRHSAEKKLVIKLIGEENIVLELGEEYNELGCESFLGDITVDNIEINGNVNTSVPGVYKITYTASFLSKTKKAVRTVKVKDSICPVITAPEAIEIFIGEDIAKAEFEYGATDNCDGNIKSRITAEYTENEIVLCVTDSSGNSTVHNINVTRIADTVPPTITLEDSKDIFIVLGEEYVETNCVASDNIDGDITQNVIITGNEDFSRVGAYTVTYSITDSSDNTVTAQRNVYVYDPDVTAVSTDENAKIIYLTFDDGPCLYTPQILDILAKYKVKTTFFVTNQKPEWQDCIGTAYKQGHSIGAHTYNHLYSIYSSSEAFFADIDALNEVIKAQTGSYTNLLRFPGGSSNSISKKYKKGIMSALVNEVTERGFIYFDWNIVSGDADSTEEKHNPDYIFNNVVSNLKTGSNIVLMHDINPANLVALPKIIEYGISNGYLFLPLNSDSPTAHHTVLN